MAFQNDLNTASPEGLAYDLRQRYAVQVGDLRADIIYERKNQNYSEWFNLLDSLYLEIASKLDNIEKTAYSKMIKEMNVAVKEDNRAWSGESTTRSSSNKIKSSKLNAILRRINLWLNQIMDDKNMFGAVESGEYGGL
jgi:GTP-binding protein EngB required for normal cell division